MIAPCTEHEMLPNLFLNVHWRPSRGAAPHLAQRSVFFKKIFNADFLFSSGGFALCHHAS